ncbi:MAG: DUF4168 domain-containing protein [Chitinophagales bacterium]
MKFNYLAIVLSCIVAFSACQGNDKSNQENEEPKNEAPAEGQQENEDETAGEQVYDEDSDDEKYQMQQQEITKVDDKELKQFVAALNEIQVINQTIQQEMISAVEAGGLEVERFSEIQQSQQSPDMESDVTEEELKQFQDAIVELEKIQGDAEKRMKQKIEDNGLTENRYREIGESLQNSPDLQARFQELMGQQQPQQPAQPQ